MIYNLFSYPANFGNLKIYKCDYFGQRLTMDRICQADDFVVNVDQENVDDELLFGSFNQNNNFKISNRDIKITTSVLFANDLSGTLFPAIDLLFNLSSWSYQGTHLSYKISIDDLTTTSLTYLDVLPLEALGITTATLSMFKMYLVNESTFIELNPTSINTTSNTINFAASTALSGSWLEIFKYGNIDSLQEFPIVYEPMFRIDTSEGSFFPCMVDKIQFVMEEDYVKLNLEIVSINYDRSTRYNYINTYNVKNMFPSIKILHKSRIQLQDYSNGITSDFDIVGLNNLEYMNALLTGSFEKSPITKLSLNIDNGMTAVYNNIYREMKRTFVSGYYSKHRKINGEMSALALRSSQPTFDRYPGLSNNTTHSFAIIFGNQRLVIPYTVWKPGNIEAKTNNWVSLNFRFVALAKERQSQPLFELYSSLK